MNYNENNKKNEGYHHRRGRNQNRNRNEKNVHKVESQNEEGKALLENEHRKPVQLTESKEYTRNLDPLVEGYRMPAMTLFDSEEAEFDLHDVKTLKVYITIPSFQETFFPTEVKKIDTILKDFSNLSSFVISNEPVFTQKRLAQSHHFEKIKVLSDFKNREFARSTGTYVYEISCLVKSVFIVDKNDRILYVRYYDDLYSNFDLNEIHEFIQDNID